MGKLLLVGYKRFVSKKGVNMCIAYVLSDFSERERLNGAVGQHCNEVFMPDNLLDFLKPEHVGREVALVYGLGNFGKPAIVDVSVR